MVIRERERERERESESWASVIREREREGERERELGIGNQRERERERDGEGGGKERSMLKPPVNKLVQKQTIQYHTFHRSGEKQPEISPFKEDPIAGGPVSYTHLTLPTTAEV